MHVPIPHEILCVGQSLTIYSYGLMIAIGLLFFSWCIKKDPLFEQLSLENRWGTLLTLAVGGACIGGRLLFYLVDNQTESIWSFFNIWQGGLSIIGAIIGVMTVLLIALPLYRIPLLPFLDLHATYAPWLQSISRIGCLFSGCCYGLPTNAIWGIYYTDILSYAPTNVVLHPTQLYSSIMLFLIGLYLYKKRFYLRKKTGQTIMLYLTLVSTERLVIDFWRDDRMIWIHRFNIFYLSAYQLVSVSIIIGSTIGMYMLVTSGIKHK